MDQVRVVIGFLFLTGWLAGSLWAFFFMNGDFFQRFGSIGAVGIALLILTPHDQTFDAGEFGGQRQASFKKLVELATYLTPWAIVLIAASTLQWGFGDLLFKLKVN